MRLIYNLELTKLFSVLNSAPFKDESLLVVSTPRALNVSHDWFDVELLNPFLSKNGAIVGYSVIVTQRSLSANEGDITTTYEAASLQDPMPPYAAIHKCPELFLVMNRLISSLLEYKA